jgi:phosphoglycolate phosphatase-like HAD superfamily hydrolase
MDKIVFLDLDGTLINTKKRYHIIHDEICNNLNIKPMSMDEYWEYKRIKTTEKEILGKCGADTDNLKLILSDRISKLEDEDYLRHDQLHNGVRNFLKTNQKDKLITLVTYRRNRNTLIDQLRKLSIDKFFHKILNTIPRNKEKFMGKVELINNCYDIEKYDTVFIGDTETDILAGKYLKMTTIAFLGGIRSSEILREYDPDYCISSWDQYIW